MSNPHTSIKPLRRKNAAIIVALAAVLALGLTLSLGFWQLRRAAQKIAVQQQIEQLKAMPAGGNSDSIAIKKEAKLGNTQTLEAAWSYRQMVLTGTWLTNLTVYLENRQMNGKFGFYVLTPLQLQEDSAAVMVQRGWIPRNPQDRTLLAPVTSAAGSVTVRGILVAHPSRVYALGSEAPNAAMVPASNPVSQGESKIRQNIDITRFAAQTGTELLPLTLLQLDDGALQKDGLQRDWPQADAGVAKHYGYAFQWFALSALIVILYVWFQIVSPRRRAASAATPGDAA